MAYLTLRVAKSEKTGANRHVRTNMPHISVHHTPGWGYDFQLDFADFDELEAEILQ